MRRRTGKKVLWTVGLILLGVMIMTLLGHKTVHTEVFIPASPNTVWAVLTDSRQYQDWNPVIVRVEGNYREGAVLTNHVREPSGKINVMNSTVVKMVPNRELNQFGGLRGLLTFDHKWVLEPVKGGTRVIQHEEYHGLGVWFWDASWVEPAYTKANEALRERVKSIVGGS